MALIPPAYLDAVLSIGVMNKDENGEGVFRSNATGFLVGEPSGENDDNGNLLYKVFVVTNKHVFYRNESKEYEKKLYFRFNTKKGTGLVFPVELLDKDDKPFWEMHEDEKVDLAVLPINAQPIIDAEINFYLFKGSDLFFAKDFGTKNITTGDGLFVLGFPMSISGKERNYVIVRQGIIARVDPEVLEDGFYYIDAAIYPGNSGGPVIVKPEFFGITGTSPNLSAGLIGVISSVDTYTDMAISERTGQPRVLFTELTGLARVVPVEFIYEIINKIINSTTRQEAIVEEASSLAKSEEVAE